MDNTKKYLRRSHQKLAPFEGLYARTGLKSLVQLRLGGYFTIFSVEQF